MYANVHNALDTQHRTKRGQMEGGGGEEVGINKLLTESRRRRKIIKHNLYLHFAHKCKSQNYGNNVYIWS